MTAVFRSCLPRFYSDINQSLSNEQLSTKTPSVISFDDQQVEENVSNTTNQPVITSQTSTSPQFDFYSRKKSIAKEGFEGKQSAQSDALLLSKPTTRVRSKKKNTKITKKRGPRYSRINEKAPPLLTRLVGTIFGDQGSNNHNNNSSSHIQQREQTKRPGKKSILPSKSTMKKQFEDNEQTLRSLVTLLTQIESSVKLTTTKAASSVSITNEKTVTDLSIEKEQSRNNNRMDDTSSSRSSDSYYLKSRAKPNRQSSSVSKRCTNTRSSKRQLLNSKTRQSDDDTVCSSSSMTSHYSSQHSPLIRRKMIDNQQQTQLFPAKNNIASMTQANEMLSSEPSWFDVMREDQTTINAWARIRRRLKPNQQKDILRALMIICANLFEVPMENKHM